VQIERICLPLFRRQSYSRDLLPVFDKVLKPVSAPSSFSYVVIRYAPRPFFFSRKMVGGVDTSIGPYFFNDEENHALSLSPPVTRGRTWGTNQSLFLLSSFSSTHFDGGKHFLLYILIILVVVFFISLPSPFPLAMSRRLTSADKSLLPCLRRGKVAEEYTCLLCPSLKCKDSIFPHPLLFQSSRD